jgi:hypothetical protein
MGDVRPLWGRRWPFLGMIIIQEAKRWPLWASCKLPHVPNKVQAHCHHPLGNVHPVLVASCPSKPSYHLQGLVPHRSNLCHSVLMRASFFFFMQGLIMTSVLRLPSQQPSDGLFSPMEVRANHLPMCTDPLVPVHWVWSCTSKTTPSMGSSVLDIIAM